MERKEASNPNGVLVRRLVIGLFGLVGMLGVFAAPFIGRLVDNLVPWLATVVATIGLLVFQGIQTGAGGVHIAAVIIVCFGIDVFRQMQQVSLTTAVFGIEPQARSRLNSIVLISVSSIARCVHNARIKPMYSL